MSATAETKVPGLIGFAVHTNVVYYTTMAATGRDYHYRSLLDTIDVEELAHHLRSGDTKAFIRQLTDSATRLREGGADFLAITSNTGHVAADDLATAVGLPLLDLRAVIVDELVRRGARNVGILSTTATRRFALYDTFLARAQMHVHYPQPATAEAIDHVIFEELVSGRTDGTAPAVLTDARAELRADGCDTILLACTDMTLIYPSLRADDTVDTTRLHAEAIARQAAYPRSVQLPQTKRGDLR
ncbi:aspartate/glutamate racemase family protein [Amycolatopsis azurea]|uniref:aspartate/glutamate racemase family protein n=1 Tax=Amycolatopsis azurea TaxID=36819 RepID=UPI0037FACC3F